MALSSHAHYALIPARCGQHEVRKQMVGPNYNRMASRTVTSAREAGENRRASVTSATREHQRASVKSATNAKE